MYEVADSVSFVTTISSSIFRMCLNFYYFCSRKTSAVLIRTRESRAYNWYAVVWEVLDTTIRFSPLLF